MGTFLRTLALGIAFSSAVSGCGQVEEDVDWDSLPVATDDEKADSTAGGLTWVRPSAFPIYCIGAPCATKQVFQVNGDDAHLLYKYDWRALKLSAKDQEAADANHFNMLLRGRYATIKVMGRDMEVFQITRANMKVSTVSGDNVERDAYFVTKAPVCSKQPCAVVQADRLNNKAGLPAEMWPTVDLTRLGLSDTQQRALLAEMQDKTGQVFVSQTTTPTGDKQISQAFRNLKAPPLK